MNQEKTIHINAVKKVKVETTWRYVPIIGEILGFWRKEEEMKAGQTIELHIKTPLNEWDRLYINGKQIDISSVVTNS